ncbi:MAG: hypothetical protein ABI416_02115 [Ginsengibacter sp.]
MKKISFILSILIISKSVTNAQVTIQPNVPTVGIIQKNQLWNLSVINGSATTFDGCQIHLILRDRQTGQEIFTATTPQFTVAPGAKQLNVNSLTPIQYNYLAGGSGNSFQDLIQVGMYTACYSLSGFLGKETDIAEECIQFDAEPLSPPMLITPSDSSELETSPSQFSWTSPTPSAMFDRLNYDVLITEIQDGQKPGEAIENNIPFYSQGNLLNTLLNYPGSVTEFAKDKWFAWQVVARDNREYAGKSEVWVFKITSPGIKSLVENAPFIKMKKDRPEKGIAPNGILKLSYINETTDNLAEVSIVDLSNQSKPASHFTAALKPGENLIEYNLNPKFHPQEGKVYQAQIINSRKEKWVTQFEIRRYQDKNTDTN